MAKGKKSTLDDLKKKNKTLDKQDLDKIKGGKKKRRWNGGGCGGIVPQ